MFSSPVAPAATPVEARAGVLLSARRDVLVTGDVGDGVVLRDRGAQAGERLVLRSFESVAFEALELDAARVVVAVATAAP